MEFKLSKGDLTRRILFSDQPSWDELANKIEVLYGIPARHVGVSYVDIDGDAVTLSTDRELHEFYHSTHRFGEPIKFDVLHLDREDKPLPETPFFGPQRNTFGTQSGIPLIFEVDDGSWQRIPSFRGGSRYYGDDDTEPHAYVETIPSDAELSLKDERDITSSSTVSDLGNIISPTLNKRKGKSRARTDSMVSVLAADNPDKPPVHVYDVSDARIPSAQTSGVKNHMDRSRSSHSMRSEATVKVALRNTTGTGTKSPTVRSPVSPGPKPSLYNDLASLLNTATTIVRSASNGEYWTPETEAGAHDVNDLAQNTEHIREEEAKKRVADAIGGMFNVLGVSPDVLPKSEDPTATSTPAAGRYALASDIRSTASERYPPVEDVFRILGGPPLGDVCASSEVETPSPSPIRPRQAASTQVQSSQSLPSEPIHLPPPPSAATGAPSIQMTDGPSTRERLEAAKRLYQEEKARYRHEREQRRKERERKLQERSPPINKDAGPTLPVENDKQPTPRHNTQAPRLIPQWQIVSNARGPYPQLEIFGVGGSRKEPGTAFAGPSRRHVSDPSGPSESTITKSTRRISRKLADMGFTDDKYPRIKSLMGSHVRPDSMLSRTEEDEIVTKMLEEILSFSPKGTNGTPTASRPASTIPTGWK
ncbi:hypothetical protein PUNSTDRAFT_95398 [Punctularia strigosozonata HHB-11173 SS5]|uniref:uncharacterized protein n=1 Tax=Punctularia strigosozonata (strain HHB-11173) TaxID=741275 RepID=UPI0004416C76|nr:uncharacterized protein PUNSTDRAFT_95398 [Punctularia strigosozonata HHB-11173 SS5]EIN13959.1 hypothetical protein PUNSTDRAFT_95398 [Punctularia strigosozonata HHB-11173 SS5]